MNWFYVSPADRQWMRKRLGRTGMCFVFLMTFTAVMNDTGPQLSLDGTPVVFVAANRLHAAQVNNAADSQRDVESQGSLPNNTTRDIEDAIEAAGQPKSVPPTGWRKTNRGWERVDEWVRQFPELYVQEKTLHDWIDHYQQERPSWVELSFAQLRRIPPLGIAVLQIIAIWLISRQAPSTRRATPTVSD